MNEKLTNALLDLIQKGQEIAPELLKEMVEYYSTSITAWAVVSGIFLFLTVVLITITVIYITKTEKWDEEESVLVLFLLLPLTIFSLFFITNCIDLYKISKAPRAYVIEELIK